MAHLTGQDRERIAAAVAAVEARTSCEFVAVVAPSASFYWSVRLGAPILISALISMAWLLWAPVPLTAAALLQLQTFTFVVAGAAFLWTPLLRAVTPKSILQERAAMLAQAQFHASGVSGTTGRTGVLLFVSLCEHHVEIIADRGVAELMGPDDWQAVIDGFVAKVRQGRLVDAFEYATAACGDLLAEKFPRRDDDRNELSDAPTAL